MNQLPITLSRVVVRLFALSLLALALLVGVITLAGSVESANTDDSGLGLGLTVLLITAMAGLVWALVAAVWAFVDTWRHGWELGQVWLVVVAVASPLLPLLVRAHGLVLTLVIAVPLLAALILGGALRGVHSSRTAS